MSRSYRHKRPHNTGSDGNNAAFVIILLLACTVWTHKALMLKVERYTMITGLIGTGLIGFAVLYKFLRVIKVWRWKRNPSLNIIDNMTGLQFERYIAGLLKQQGFRNVQLTEQYDLGVDIVAMKDGVTWGIQVKRYSGLVKADAIRQVVTALKMYHCDQAMAITNSFFSNVAKELADSNDCTLVDRIKLSNWISSD
jgi:HJR/Mrr/RecB family endonuclease